MDPNELRAQAKIANTKREAKAAKHEENFNRVAQFLAARKIRYTEQQIRRRARRGSLKFDPWVNGVSSDLERAAARIVAEHFEGQGFKCEIEDNGYRLDLWISWE